MRVSGQAHTQLERLRIVSGYGQSLREVERILKVVILARTINLSALHLDWLV
jgi:hypothetical protein